MLQADPTAKFRQSDDRPAAQQQDTAAEDSTGSAAAAAAATSELQLPMPEPLCCPPPTLWCRLRPGRRRTLALFLATFYLGLLMLAGSCAGVVALLALRYPRLPEPPPSKTASSDGAGGAQVYPLSLLGGAVAGLGLLLAAYSVARALRGRRLGAFRRLRPRLRSRLPADDGPATSSSSSVVQTPHHHQQLPMPEPELPAGYWPAARTNSPPGAPPPPTLPEPVA